MAYLAETYCRAAKDPSRSSLIILNRVIDLIRSVTQSPILPEGCYTETGACDQYPDIVATFFFCWPGLRQMDADSLVSVGGGAGVDE